MIWSELKIGEGKLVIFESVESLNELEAEIKNPEILAGCINFSSDKRKREYLSVRVALKEIFGEETSVFYHPSGKPFLRDKHYNISISHSERWIAILIHPEKNVGVDIERNTEKVRKLYTRFLSEKEQEYLFHDVDASKLCIAWSAKEALFKIIGIEAVDFGTQLEILPFKIEQEGKILARHLVSGKIYDLSYYLTDDYTLVYCID